MRTEVIERPRVVMARGSEQGLASTLGAWRACDVYITIPQNMLAQNEILSVFCYAVGKSGVRSCVASGRYIELGHGTQNGALWICSARAEAERWDVTYSIAPAGVIADQLPFDVTVIASDEATETPPWVGAIFLGAEGNDHGETQVLNNTTQTIGGANAVGGLVLGPGPEFLGVHAINVNAAARFAQIFDSPTAPVNGNRPTASYGMLATGAHVRDEPQGFRGRRFDTGIWLAKSTTPDVLTLAAAGDVAAGLWVR